MCAIGRKYGTSDETKRFFFTYRVEFPADERRNPLFYDLDDRQGARSQPAVFSHQRGGFPFKSILVCFMFRSRNGRGAEEGGGVLRPCAPEMCSNRLPLVYVRSGEYGHKRREELAEP